MKQRENTVENYENVENCKQITVAVEKWENLKLRQFTLIHTKQQTTFIHSYTDMHTDRNTENNNKMKQQQLQLY